VLLENKNAIVYGAAGAIGGAVARAFARDGARVFLAGRTLAALEESAASTGGFAGTSHRAPSHVGERQRIAIPLPDAVDRPVYGAIHAVPPH
jgi:NAD(P)-dependent dehydrogenase (short-subunit alcohol dehydrogenase family)